jgi:hypothetical protein
METKRHWQDWANMILGAWLFTSPFFGIGSVNSIAAWNGYIFGAIIVLLSATALFLSQIWEDWINMAIGIWLFVSPFVLGFYHQHTVMLNHIDVGVALFGIALWAVAMYTPYASERHEHHIGHTV